MASSQRVITGDAAMWGVEVHLRFWRLAKTTMAPPDFDVPVHFIFLRCSAVLAHRQPPDAGLSSLLSYNLKVPKSKGLVPVPGGVDAEPHGSIRTGTEDEVGSGANAK
jgi:hypothetical protein